MMDVKIFLEEKEIQNLCTQLEYGRPPAKEALVTSIDNFLTSYSTAKGVRGTEPRDFNNNQEALDDIMTQWLNGEGNGTYFWPSTAKDYAHTLRYSHYQQFITDILKRLVCAINQVRQKAKVPSLKRYTAIAQARLVSEHKSARLEIPADSNDADLRKTLSKVLDKADGDNHLTSFDALCQMFEVQLREGVSVLLPEFFHPLRAYQSLDERDNVILRSFLFLKRAKIVQKSIGSSSDSILHYAAEVCGELCFRNGFVLPDDLNDETLPDLLRSLTAVEFGRVKATKFLS